MKPWIPDAIRGGITLIVEGVKAIRARRAGKRRGAKAILDEHGPLRSSEARERAHEALERERREREP